VPGLQDERGQRELPQAHSQDGARQADSPDTGDRQVRESADGLGRRLDRLPHGHPSSPYHDDSTRKPPLVRLKNLELPLPGEEREPNGGTSRDLGVSRAVRPRADDHAGGVEAYAEHETGPEPAAQDWQSALRQPDLAPSDRTPERSEHADRPPADRPSRDSEPADSAPADSEPAGRQPAGRQPATWEPAGREHETAAGDPEPAADRAADLPAADRAADLDDDEPATQDQPAIIDEPAPVEQPQAKQADRLTAEQVRIAVRAHGQCRLAEGRSVFGSYGESGLTPTMRRIEEQLDHGELAPKTERYALKSLDRFQEKLANLIADEPDKSAEEHAVEIHDGVRYTFLFNHDTYTQDLAAASKRLEAEGFIMTVRKNTWGNDEYKGINTRWIDPESSLLFEIQFHTQKSWDAKQQSHDAYEKINRLETPESEKERLRDYQREISAAVPHPPGWQEITDYRR
jgi:hypothetical protein